MAEKLINMLGNAKCDWTKMAFKDRRRGFMWKCWHCKFIGKSKSQPVCALREALSSIKGGK